MDWDNTPVYLKTKELQNKELSTDDQILAKEFKKAEKWMKSIIDESNRNLGYIHTVGEIAEKLHFSTDTIYNMIDEDQSKDILKREFDLWEEGNHFLFEKNSLYKFISKNTYKYTNGKKSPCKYDRLPEYLKVDDCAKMLEIDPHKFRRTYVDKYIKKDHKVLDGVEVLKIGSTVRIEKASFELWIKSEGEKAK